MNRAPINMASIAADLARGPIRTGAEIAAAHHRRREAADAMYEALVTVTKLIAEEPFLHNDDEVWGAFSQCVAALAKARGE